MSSISSHRKYRRINGIDAGNQHVSEQLPSMILQRYEYHKADQLAMFIAILVRETPESLHFDFTNSFLAAFIQS
jgi:hypothetical protein